jgi:hypothetical protein
MSLAKCLVRLSLAAIILPALGAESHCPGNVASLLFHIVQRSQIIVPVMINHTGPYDFLVDTGTQFTMIDPSLVTDLHLKTQGSAEVHGVGFTAKASFALIDSLEAGAQSVASHLVEVHNLEQLQSAGLHIRGILGGNFLEHFDVMIDYQHSMICLDNAKAMRASVKGVHVELVTPIQDADEVSSAGLVIVPVHLSGAAQRLLLVLDSGTNVPFLYNPAKYLAAGLAESTTLLGRGGDGVQRPFAFLPRQNMQIGSLNFQQISFIAQAASVGDAPKTKVDGLLPTALFRRVFISYAHRFAVLDPPY